jgi:hypothetical protein
MLLSELDGWNNWEREIFMPRILNGGEIPDVEGFGKVFACTNIRPIRCLYKASRYEFTWF